MNQRENRIMVQRIESLDEGLLAPLVKQSVAEGYRHLERLVEDWKSGTNRFDRENEALFVATYADAAPVKQAVDQLKPDQPGTHRARSEVVWVGIVGVNVDPYLDDPSIGRVRRLYVDPAFRRAGVGRKLVERVLDHAQRQGPLGFVEHVVGDVSLPAAHAILRPRLRNVESKVGGHVRMLRRHHQADANLTVGRLTRTAGVLTLHPDRGHALLQVPGLMDHQYRITVAECPTT